MHNKTQINLKQGECESDFGFINGTVYHNWKFDEKKGLQSITGNWETD